MLRNDSLHSPRRETPLSFHQEIHRLCREHADQLGAELGLVAEKTLERARESGNADQAAQMDRVVRGIREIRDAGDAKSALTALVEAATLFCSRAALLLHSGGSVIGFRSAVAGERASSLDRFSVDVASAPAIAHAIESREAVVTTVTRDSFSFNLWKRLAGQADTEVRVHPVMLRDTVLAVLVANGGTERSGIIEALVLTAEAWIEALGSRTAKDRR